MAYFDNAATTYPKPDDVYKFMDQFYRNNGANAGRGNYELAQHAGALIADTRKLICKVLECPSKQVVFTPSATIALNIIIQGLLQTRVKNIYITPFEHNAVTRILHHYEEKQEINVQQLAVSMNMHYDLARIEQQFKDTHPDLIIMSHASNVIGLIAPVEEIALLGKKYNATTIVDMAQTAGIVKCNVGLETIDFAVFAGHKTLLGPTGISGFVMKPEAELPAVLFGGTGFDSANQDMPSSIPERYEIGTLNICGIAGLNASLRWIEKQSIEHLFEEEKIKRQRLIDLLSKYEFIRLVGNEDTCKYVGIVSVLIEGISSDSAGPIFDHLGIAVRTGLQCAPIAHRFLQTYPAGTIRLSVNCFTTEKDFDELAEALDYIKENL